MRELDNDNISSSPHYLMELSDRQWKRMMNNSIIISGYNEEIVERKRVVASYNNVKYGEKLKMQRKTYVSTGSKVTCRTPLLDRIEESYISIVARKRELIGTNPNLIVLDGSSQEMEYVSCKDSYKPSGMLLLFFAMLKRQKKCNWVCLG